MTAATNGTGRALFLIRSDNTACRSSPLATDVGRMVDGTEAEGLRDVAWLLRTGDRRAFDEGRLRGMGRRQQPVSPGRGEGNHRSGHRHGDDEVAWRRPETRRRLGRAVRRASRTAQEPRWRLGEETRACGTGRQGQET